MICWYFIDYIYIGSQTDTTRERKPFLVSYHVLSCFRFAMLEHSIQAINDSDFQRLQYIARLHPSKYKNDDTLIDEFIKLLDTKCTFVESWNDPKITPSTYRLYGKTFLPKKLNEIL